MYKKISEFIWDDPTKQIRKKRDFLTERLCQNHGAVMGSDDIVFQFWQLWQ